MALKADSLIGRRIILTQLLLDALPDGMFKRMQTPLYQKKSIFSLFLQRPIAKNFAPGKNIQTASTRQDFWGQVYREELHEERGLASRGMSPCLAI